MIMRRWCDSSRCARAIRAERALVSSIAEVRMATSSLYKSSHSRTFDWSDKETFGSVESAGKVTLTEAFELQPTEFANANEKRPSVTTLPATAFKWNNRL